MKIAVFSILSLLCVQSLYAAYIPVDSDANKTVEDDSVYLMESRIDRYDQRINLPACFNAVKSYGGLAISGWNLFWKRNSIYKKAEEEKKKCSTGTVPEEVEKCKKNVEDVQKKEVEDLIKEIWNLAPVIITAFIQTMQCLF